jgi:3-oxoacyl-[acyl-carrier-protein] synthase II
VPMLMPNGPAGIIGLEVGAQGPVRATVSACASGADAIALAYDTIVSGRADVVVTGGTEACIHPIPLAGFGQMRALSSRHDDPAGASRPFDADRDGFVMGEGAGILVLESESHASRRGARAYAELAGAGITADSHHMTAPEPTGAGAARAMRMALSSAGIAPEQVGYVNAHATSTPVGDVAECAAIRTVLGAVPVSATKSMTGHLLGAAGAVEAIVTALSVRDGVVHPTRNYEKPDEQCDVDCVPEGARRLALEAALSNSFGFGGHNVSLAIRKV